MTSATLELFPTSPPAFPSAPQWAPEAPEEPSLFRSYSGSSPCSSETELGTAPPRHAWLDAVGDSTQGFREARAAQLRTRGEDVRAAADRRQIGVIALTSEGWSYCPLEYWVAFTAGGWPYCPLELPPDARDRQAWEIAGGSVAVRHVDTRWWENRAAALLDKVGRVKNCGASAVLHQCTDCGVTREAAIRCRDVQLCLHCRTVRIGDYVQRFEKAHEATHRRVREAGYLLNHARHGGRWSAKFITVTIPHSDDLGDDLRVFPEAWPRFLQRIRNHLKLDRGLTPEMLDTLAYVRVLEITPGGEGAKGHAHMHLYWYGPFVHQALLAHWWGMSLPEKYRERLPVVGRDELLEAQEDLRKRAELAALLVTRRGRCGRPLQQVFRPVIDIRQCKGSARDIAAELAKYLIKDGHRDKATGELHFVDPEWFAVAYQAMCGRQAITACNHFWVLDALPDPKNVRCPDCGGWHVKTFFATTEAARGPPP